ncbi:hypothetical protein [Allocoleopsis franciscana]|uniref:hypothetical protein n=1 Tax=Allocoleopsis franciscana TaxID=2886352 RepID=UPI0002F19934|nr:hypothetical protein [Allocoleopsis franciscana]
MHRLIPNTSWFGWRVLPEERTRRVWRLHLLTCENFCELLRADPLGGVRQRYRLSSGCP